MQTDIFTKIPIHLFRPLGAQRNRLYWQVLIRLNNNLFEEDTCGNDYGHAKSAVVHVIENVIDQHSALWGENQEDEILAVDNRSKAYIIYQNFKKSGWLVESRYGYHEYVSMLPRVAQLLAVLIEVSEGRPLVMNGKLKSLRSAAREVLSEPAHGADTLIELAKDAARFSRHLNSIRSSIKELYDRIKCDIPIREVIDGFFQSFMRDIFIRDYATIKTTENPLTIRDELLDIVAKLRYTNDVKQKLLRGYQEIYNAETIKITSGHLEADLSKLEWVFMNIEHQLDAIDQMKVRYERRVDTVIDYATRSPRSIGRDLKRIAKSLCEHDELSHNDSLSPLLPVTLHESLGESRFALVRKQRTPPKPRKVNQNTISNELMARIKEERRARDAIHVDEQGLLDFLSIQMGRKQTDETQHFVINNIRDYFCVLNLQRAAKMSEFANHQYPELTQKFALSATKEWVKNDFLNIQKVIITKKEKQ